MDREQLLNKVISTVANPEGVLPPEKAATFISWVIDESVLRPHSRIYGMNSSEYQAPTLLLGDIFEGGVEGVEPTTDGTVSIGGISLRCAEIVGKLFVTDTFIEDNANTSGFYAQLAREIATAYANKEDDIFFNATFVDGSTDMYHQYDGFMKKAQTSPYSLDFNGDTVDLIWISQLVKKLPSKWTRNRGKMRLYVPPTLAQDIVELLVGRNTTMGDTAIRYGALDFIYGIPIIPATPIAENYTLSGGTGSYTRMILTLANNTLVGDRRIYRIERQRNALARGTYLVPSSRVGFTVETTQAIAYATNIKLNIT